MGEGGLRTICNATICADVLTDFALIQTYMQRILGLGVAAVSATTKNNDDGRPKREIIKIINERKGVQKHRNLFCKLRCFS